MEVGIRDFRSRLSAWLRLAEQGDTIIVTDRGRPIARVVPIARQDAFERLVAEGVIQLPERPRTRANLGEMVTAKESVADLVIAQRR